MKYKIFSGGKFASKAIQAAIKAEALNLESIASLARRYELPEKSGDQSQAEWMKLNGVKAKILKR